MATIGQTSKVDKPYAHLIRRDTDNGTFYDLYVYVNLASPYVLGTVNADDSARDNTYGGTYPAPNTCLSGTLNVTINVGTDAGGAHGNKWVSITNISRSAAHDMIEIHVVDPTKNNPDKRRGKTIVIYDQADTREEGQ